MRTKATAQGVSRIRVETRRLSNYKRFIEKLFYLKSLYMQPAGPKHQCYDVLFF